MPFICLFAIVCGACGETPEPFEDTYDPNLLQCADEGGVCTQSPEVVCAPGTQPVTADDPNETNCEGHCCVPTDFSICTDQPDTNCVPDACTGHWRLVEGGEILCTTNRVCCFWMP